MDANVDGIYAGWDPIFEYEGKTYAEMDKEAKVRDYIIIFSAHSFFYFVIKF